MKYAGMKRNLCRTDEKEPPHVDNKQIQNEIKRFKIKIKMTVYFRGA